MKHLRTWWNNTHIHVPILPVIELGQVDGLQQCIDCDGPNDPSSTILRLVQFVVAFPRNQYDQLPQEQTESRIDQQFETNVLAQMWVQFNAAVKVVDRVSSPVIQSRVGGNEGCSDGSVRVITQVPTILHLPLMYKSVHTMNPNTDSIAKKSGIL